MSGEGQAAGAAGAAGSAGAAGAAGGGEAPWHAGADSETIGYLQNRGWDKLSPKDAALAATKSYREAEKHIGAPPDQLLRLPKDANDKDGWGKVWNRLGAPADPKDYDFSGVKFADGAELSPDIANQLRAAAAANHLTKDQAAAVAKTVAQMVEQAEEADNTAYMNKLEVEKGTLRTNWGANAAQYKVIAENAAKKLGVTAEEVSALEQHIGYARVMDMFRNIGQRIGEDQFISSGSPGGTNTMMTRNMAVARLENLMNDVEWNRKFQNGDAAALQEFDNLTKIKVGFVG